jgi:hypothetical protein
MSKGNEGTFGWVDVVLGMLPAVVVAELLQPGTWSTARKTASEAWDRLCAQVRGELWPDGRSSRWSWAIVRMKDGALCAGQVSRADRNVVHAFLLRTDGSMRETLLRGHAIKSVEFADEAAVRAWFVDHAAIIKPENGDGFIPSPVAKWLCLVCASTRAAHMHVAAPKILGALLSKSRRDFGPKDLTIVVQDETITAVHVAPPHAPISPEEWKSAAAEGLPMGPWPCPATSRRSAPEVCSSGSV